MKYFLFIVLTCIFSQNPSAQTAQLDTLKLTSTITVVTAFFQGAEITRKIPLKAVSGRHVVMLENLPLSLDPDRINARRFDGVEILSVNTRIRIPENKELKKRKEELNKNSEEVQDEISLLRDRKRVLQTEEKVLMENINFQHSEAGASVQQIREAANFYRERLNELGDRRFDIDMQVRSLQDSLKSIFEQINQVESIRNKPGTDVFITLACEKNVTGELKLQYFASMAGWKPSYDFRVESITEPLQVVYNGNVFQSTGEDWKNVNLTLSSANPNVSGTAPKLETWYIHRGEQSTQKPSPDGIGQIEGRITDAQNGEPLPYVVVTAMQGDAMVSGTSTDMDGRYVIKPLLPGQYNLQVTYIGYADHSQIINVEQSQISTANVNLHASHIALEEIAVQDKRYRADEGNATFEMQGVSRSDAISNRKKKELKWITWNLYDNEPGESPNTPIERISTNISYELEVPYSIRSNGQDHLIPVMERNVDVQYLYHAVPKLDRNAFLIARIPNWGQLDLLSGNTSIYYQGAYTGMAYLDADQPVDTLQISLGRDQSIKIDRERNRKVDDKRFLGSNTKQTIGWEITVKNNKSVPIDIEIFDQYPLSEYKSVEVEQIDHGNAALDNENGKLTWTRTIPPAGSEKVNFTYSVKFPTSGRFFE